MALLTDGFVVDASLSYKETPFAQLAVLVIAIMAIHTISARFIARVGNAVKTKCLIATIAVTNATFT